MNYRIKEISEQAIRHAGQENQFNTTNDQVYTKLSEMIIKECINVCSSRTSSSEEYNAGRMHCIDDIKKHFGINQ